MSTSILPRCIGQGFGAIWEYLFGNEMTHHASHLKDRPIELRLIAVVHMLSLIIRPNEIGNMGLFVMETTRVLRW